METPVTGFLGRSTVRSVVAVLRGGGVAVLPTDTLYGFHCLVSRAGAIRTVRGLKRRRAGVGFILFVSDWGMAERIVRRWPGDSRSVLSRAWPAPLTAILPAARTVPRSVAPGGAVALRIPALAALRRLARDAGEPVLSTSVNISGRGPLVRIDEIRTTFPGLGAYISRRGRPSLLPSTVVDFTTETPRLIREGRYRWRPVRREEPRGD